MGAVHVEQQDVAGHLADLGLGVETIHRVLARAEADARHATANHPVNAEGWFRWAGSVRYLREALVPKRWRRARWLNFELVVHPGGRVAIAVASGDQATGNPTVTPRTSSQKGAVTAAAVAVNTDPPGLFDGTPFRRQTWFLLYHRTAEQIRAELSLPDNVGSTGHVDSWSERIILPPYDFGEKVLVGAEPQPELPIDVPVHRRTN